MTLREIETRSNLIRKRQLKLIDLYHESKRTIKKLIANRLIREIDKELCYLENLYRKAKFEEHKNRQFQKELAITPSERLN